MVHDRIGKMGNFILNTLEHATGSLGNGDR
jgi:hypothetical protein